MPTVCIRISRPIVGAQRKLCSATLASSSFVCRNRRANWIIECSAIALGEYTGTLEILNLNSRAASKSILSVPTLRNDKFVTPTSASAANESRL